VAVVIRPILLLFILLPSAWGGGEGGGGGGEGGGGGGEEEEEEERRRRRRRREREGDGEEDGEGEGKGEGEGSCFSSVCLQMRPRSGEWATTLSLEASGQRTGSVHPTEKLCSHFLLIPKTLQSERADKRDGGSKGS
jgi:hypothetical protein